MPGTASERVMDGSEFHLSDILGTRVLTQGKAVGRLSDLVIVETGTMPEVTHVVVTRPFGNPALLVPWEKVRSFADQGVVLELEALGPYQKEPTEGMVLLKDHVLDKKVLDTEGKEVEVVFDVGLVERAGKLHVGFVDLSRYGMLKRMGLR